MKVPNRESRPVKIVNTLLETEQSFNARRYFMTTPNDQSGLFKLESDPSAFKAVAVDGTVLGIVSPGTPLADRNNWYILGSFYPDVDRTWIWSRKCLLPRREYRSAEEAFELLTALYRQHQKL